jgi:hypothetical protein
MEDGMKTNRVLLVVITMALALMAASASAQTINLKADVPFDFSAGKAMLRSGPCAIQTLSNTVVQVKDDDNNSVVAMLIANDTRSAHDAKLMFNRYGDSYFLARIETPEISYKVPVSPRERELAKHGLPQQIAVLAYTPSPAGQ